MRDGILAKKTASAEAKEFLKRMACVNLCFLSIFAMANGFLCHRSSHLSLKMLGDRTSWTVGSAKNEILQDLKC